MWTIKSYDKKKKIVIVFVGRTGEIKPQFNIFLFKWRLREEVVVRIDAIEGGK
jgi:hypothetical protein